MAYCTVDWRWASARLYAVYVCVSVSICSLRVTVGGMRLAFGGHICVCVCVWRTAQIQYIDNFGMRVTDGWNGTRQRPIYHTLLVRRTHATMKRFVLDCLYVCGICAPMCCPCTLVMKFRYRCFVAVHRTCNICSGRNFGFRSVWYLYVLLSDAATVEFEFFSADKNCNSSI